MNSDLTRGTNIATRPPVELVIEYGGWWLCLCLLVAPLAMGGRPIWARDGIEAMLWLGAVPVLVARLGVWLGLKARRRTVTYSQALGRAMESPTLRSISGVGVWDNPSFYKEPGLRSGLPLVPLLALLILLVTGWFSTINPVSHYDPIRHRFALLPAIIPGIGGTVDQQTSLESMLQFSSVSLFFLAVCSLASYSIWRSRFLWTMACTGAALVFLAMLDRLHLLPVIDRMTDPGQGFRFGTLAYHGNAGAFLNLTIAAAGGLALQSRGGRALSASSALLAVCIIGAFVNVSRASQVLAGISILSLGAFYLFSRRARCVVKPAVKIRFEKAIFIAAAMLIIAAVAIAGTEARRRWGSVGQQLTGDSARSVLWRICLEMCGNAGPLGFGPGSFKLLLPLAPHIDSLYAKWIVTWHTPGTPVSIWSNAHQEVLQAIIEWGWVGVFAWGLLFLGGLLRGIATSLRLAARIPATSPALRQTGTSGLPGEGRGGGRFTIPAAVIAMSVLLAHAMLDFPLQILPIQMYAATFLSLLWVTSSFSSAR